MSSILTIVKGSPLFLELYDDEIMKIVDRCQVLTLQKGDFIFREGDVGDELFIILNGTAHVEKHGIRLADLKKGDLFGELVLLNENTRSADIVVDNYTDLLIMSYSDIFGLYEHEPKIFSVLILNLARLLTKRLKDSSATIQALNQKLKSAA
jgi:CRP/FNR family cyclic AMP-dependent transcriptional regulator